MLLPFLGACKLLFGEPGGRLGVGLVERLKARGKDSEGCADEDAPCAAFLEHAGGLDDRAAGGDHVIDDDDVLPGHIGAEEGVVDDRMLSADRHRVVIDLVEHAHVDAEHVGEVDSAAHAVLVRAHDHEMVVIDHKVRGGAEDRLDELVGRAHRLKTGERNRILHTGVVGLEGDDIFNAERHELLEGMGGIQGFADGTHLDAALVEVGHDHVDAVSFGADRTDHTL